MSLPKAFMDELRSRIPLSEILGKRMKLTRAGREFKGCCPFHKEKTPSFTVNDIKGFYHCFGCGAHGDSIGFLMDHDNLSFIDAIEYLAAIAGMQVPKQSPEEQKRYKEQASLYDLMELTANYYSQQLKTNNNKKIMQYLGDRGFSSCIIEEFKMGFSTSDDGLKEKLLKAGFKRADLLKSGLFRVSTKKPNDIYAFFRNRLMFPVKNVQGRVVAFGGRILPEKYGGFVNSSAPKYINSPQSDIFHKGRMLYGLSKSRKALGEGKKPIVVEGYMDVIALVQAGFKAAVAPLGTALTEEQVQELWRYMPDNEKCAILCFDGDKAGQRAASRSLDRILPILKPDHSIKFAFLPEEHDPDSLIKEEGVSAIDKIFKHSISIFEMMWNEELESRDMSQPESKAGIRASLIKKARLIADMNVQEFFIREIKQKVNDVFLSNKLNNYKKFNKEFYKGKQFPPNINSPYRPNNIKIGSVKSKKLQQEQRIKILLALIINHPNLYDEFGEGFGMIKIIDEDYDKIRGELVILLDDKKNLDYQTVKQHLRELGYDSILKRIFDNSLYIHAAFARPDEIFETVRKAWLEIWEIGFKNIRTA